MRRGFEWMKGGEIAVYKKATAPWLTPDGTIIDNCQKTTPDQVRRGRRPVRSAWLRRNSIITLYTGRRLPHSRVTHTFPVRHTFFLAPLDTQRKCFKEIRPYQVFYTYTRLVTVH